MYVYQMQILWLQSIAAASNLKAVKHYSSSHCMYVYQMQIVMIAKRCSSKQFKSCKALQYATVYVYQMQICDQACKNRAYLHIKFDLIFEL